MSEVGEKRPLMLPDQHPIDRATLATGSAVLQYALNAALSTREQVVMAGLERPTAVYQAAATATLENAEALSLPVHSPEERRHHARVLELMRSLTSHHLFSLPPSPPVTESKLLESAADEYFGRSRQLRQFERLRELVKAAREPEQLLYVTQAYGLIRSVVRQHDRVPGRLMQPNELSHLLLSVATRSAAVKRQDVKVQTVTRAVEPSLRQLMGDERLKQIFSSTGEGSLEQFTLTGLVKGGIGAPEYEAGLLLVATFAHEGSNVAQDILTQHVRLLRRR